MSSYILLWVFRETCKSEPETREIPMPWVSRRNQFTGRKSLQLFAQQLFAQKSVKCPSSRKLWRWIVELLNLLYRTKWKKQNEVLIEWLNDGKSEINSFICTFPLRYFILQWTVHCWSQKKMGSKTQHWKISGKGRWVKRYPEAKG